jgi:hypothetical protein
MRRIHKIELARLYQRQENERKRQEERQKNTVRTNSKKVFWQLLKGVRTNN